MRPALVYFMKPKGKKGPIKIGCSYAPKDRLEALSAWSPYPLEIIGTFVGTFQDEGFLHACLAEHHLHREWFKPAPLVIQTMQKVLASGSIESVRTELAPTGHIRKKIRRKKTDDEKLRFSYSRRVSFCQDRTSKVQPDRWHCPEDVNEIIQAWGGYRYWDHSKKDFVRVGPTIPTAEQIALVEQYLSDPLTLSVTRTYARPKKDPICVPVFGQEIEAVA